MKTSLKNGGEATLTEQCASKLRTMIQSGELKSQGEFINERLLRDQFSVSRVTMRRALAQLQEENLLLSIPYKGYILGPAGVARGLSPAKGKSKTRNQILWVKAPQSRSMRNDIHDQLIFQAACKEAKDRGLDIQICRLSLKELVGTIKNSLQKNLYGIALDWPEREIADTLLLEGIPVVIVEYFYEGLAIDAVIQDDAGGIEQAVDSFCKAGHSRIGLIVWARSASQPVRRRSAFAASMLRRNIMGSSSVGLSARFDAEGGREAVSMLLDQKERPTALIISHFEMSAGIFDELEKRKIRPGKDISIIVWGTPETQALWLAGTPWENLPLDLISWSREEMGKMITRILEARHNEPAMPPLRVEIPTILTASGSVVPV